MNIFKMLYPLKRNEMMDYWLKVSFVFYYTEGTIPVGALNFFVCKLAIQIEIIIRKQKGNGCLLNL